MPHSHHSHSGQFCKHAAGTLEDVVKQAIAQGFQLFGLTEHVPRYRVADLYPEEVSRRAVPDPTEPLINPPFVKRELPLSILTEQFASFLEEAQRLKTCHASEINLLIGLETEFITSRDLEELIGILSRHQGAIDYIVGSIHHVGGIPIDFDEPTYQKALQSFTEEGDSEHSRLEKFFSAYYDAQYELLQRFMPEVIGHIDLCRLYTPNLEFMNYPLVWEKIGRNVRYAVAYGALFEVNAAAFRKKWSTAYPGKDIAELILKHGGRFALSDDSHGPHAVGLNYDRTFHYLKSLEVKEIWYLQQSNIPNAAGRHVRPSKLENWSEDRFWSNLFAGKHREREA